MYISGLALLLESTNSVNIYTKDCLLLSATATQDRVDVTLDAELFLHDDSLKPRRHRRNKSPCDDLPPECRAMSLSSFPLTSAVVSDVDTHSLTGYHYVAVGCSDAMIRYVCILSTV